MMDWSNGHWGAGDWWAMTLMMVLFWAVVVALALWMIRGLAGRGSAEPGADRPRGARELLAERFARGEIDEDEFQRRCRALDESRARHPGVGAA